MLKNTRLHIAQMVGAEAWEVRPSDFMNMWYLFIQSTQSTPTKTFLQSWVLGLILPEVSCSSTFYLWPFVKSYVISVVTEGVTRNCHCAKRKGYYLSIWTGAKLMEGLCNILSHRFC